eukprot:gene24492-10486_t
MFHRYDRILSNHQAALDQKDGEIQRLRDLMEELEKRWQTRLDKVHETMDQMKQGWEKLLNEAQEERDKWKKEAQKNFDELSRLRSEVEILRGETMVLKNENER